MLSPIWCLLAEETLLKQSRTDFVGEKYQDETNSSISSGQLLHRPSYSYKDILSQVSALTSGVSPRVIHYSLFSRKGFGDEDSELRLAWVVLVSSLTPKEV